MELFIVDAFANKIFEGNQAGVVLLNDSEVFPKETLMQKIAAELKHSETVFVKKSDSHIFQLRYFTPEGEIALCGHATVSAFTVLRNERLIDTGSFFADTSVGRLNIDVEPNLVWLETAQGKIEKHLNAKECAKLYSAYDLSPRAQPDGMRACIVNTGLADILLPVNSKEALDHAVQNREEIIRISRELAVTGVHMFYYEPSLQATAYCRNFAPLYGIDEESATGTSNASLTYYLSLQNRIKPNVKNTFIQGEAMGKPSVILSRMNDNGDIYIGGNAVISVKGKFNF